MNGYYTHKASGDIARCFLNDTEDTFRFFSALWGPHGECKPGQWQVSNGQGFSIAVDANEFAEDFEWFGDVGDPRVKVTVPDITSPDFHKPLQDLMGDG